MTLLEQQLHLHSSPEKAAFLSRFFKTGKGQYGEGDIFMGITMPQIRAFVKSFPISVQEAEQLLHSPLHECRMAALISLVSSFSKAKRNPEVREQIFNIYIDNLNYINNWDLVDVTCKDIVGGFLWDKDRAILYELAQNSHLWSQRVAIISTAHFISKRQFTDTILLAKILLNHKHDLIHKAVGWMLREVGKKDELTLIEFLDQYATSMPRTMLRYAIERLPPTKRKYYMLL